MHPEYLFMYVFQKNWGECVTLNGLCDDNNCLFVFALPDVQSDLFHQVGHAPFCLLHEHFAVADVDGTGLANKVDLNAALWSSLLSSSSLSSTPDSSRITAVKSSERSLSVASSSSSHVKDPEVHIRFRWITEAHKRPGIHL